MVKFSLIKKYVKGLGFRTSKEVTDILNRKVQEILDKAVMKAKDDKRKTIQGQDII